MLGTLLIMQEYAMAATQGSQQVNENADDWLADGQAPHQPDEDGPHDVPDDKVIDKTLPNHTPQDRRPSSD
jgi:hypothetical protein